MPVSKAQHSSYIKDTLRRAQQFMSNTAKGITVRDVTPTVQPSRPMVKGAQARPFVSSLPPNQKTFGIGVGY